jgi:hypothetical protein
MNDKNNIQKLIKKYSGSDINFFEINSLLHDDKIKVIR